MANCLFCDYSPIKAEYELYYECYYQFVSESINKCSCGKYKDAGYAQCRDCYNKLGKSGRQKKRRVDTNMIKGRIAETIVEEMFLAMGFEVFAFGMEHTIPGFGNRYSPRSGLVASKIRRKRDFVVTRENETFFVEAKYRSNGEFDFQKHYGDDYPYPEAYFVLISPKHIKIQEAEELTKGEPFVYLDRCPAFEVDRDVVVQFVELAKTIFGGTGL